MTMILDSEKLNPQYNQNSVLTMPWIAWGSRDPPPPPPLATGLVWLCFLLLLPRSFSTQYLLGIFWGWLMDPCCGLSLWAAQTAHPNRKLKLKLEKRRVKATKLLAPNFYKWGLSLPVPVPRTSAAPAKVSCKTDRGGHVC